MRQLCAIGTTLTLALFSAAPALASGGFVPLPQLGGKDDGLQARFVRYQDNRVTIQVKNVTKQARTFKSAGLFFVPEGNPEGAPQRMGAAGPFEVEEQGRWRDGQSLQVAPGQTVTLRLKVFCLDSHRASPSDGQPFRFAKKRLPAKLSTDIEKSAAEINAQPMTPASKSSAIQSNVWSQRNKKWIKLEGERKNEHGSRHAPRQLRRLPVNPVNIGR